MNWKARTRSGDQITTEQMLETIRTYGVELRGGGTDESPFVYRKHQEVLDAHAEKIEVMHVLKPIGVCMAGADEFDPETGIKESILSLHSSILKRASLRIVVIYGLANPPWNLLF